MGIFPSGGTDPQNTLMAQVGLKLVEGCKALFYRSNCNPRFDPVAMNALLSEIGNAVNALGIDYDCSKLDNLKTALTNGNNTAWHPHKFPDGDDLIRGRFDNVEGHSTVKELLQLTPGVLDNTDTLADTDLIAIGRIATVGGEEIIKGFKMTITEFRELLAPPTGFGANYSWKSAWGYRNIGQAAKNTHDSPIMVSVMGTGDKSAGFFVSKTGAAGTWLSYGQGSGNSGEKSNVEAIIPPGQYYLNAISDTYAWNELTPDD
jgi:hypothetical protein